jgi:hypothetical protein
LYKVRCRLEQPESCLGIIGAFEKSEISNSLCVQAVVSTPHMRPDPPNRPRPSFDDKRTTLSIAI